MAHAKQPDLQILVQINQLLNQIETQKELVVELSNQAKRELESQQLKQVQLLELEKNKYQTQAMQTAFDQQLEIVKAEENQIREILFSKVSKAVDVYFSDGDFAKFVLNLFSTAKNEYPKSKLVADPLLAQKFSLPDFEHGEAGKLQIVCEFKTYILDPELVKLRLIENILPELIAENKMNNIN